MLPGILVSYAATREFMSRGMNILATSENIEQADIVQFFVSNFNILGVKVYGIETRLFIKSYRLVEIFAVDD